MQQPDLTVDQRIEILKVVDAHLLHDLQLFWSRANAFLLVHGALFSVVLAIADAGADADGSIPGEIRAAGVALAMLWLAISVGTHQRIRIWRSALIEASCAVDRNSVLMRAESAQRLSHDEKLPLPDTSRRRPWFSPTRRWFSPTPLSLLLPRHRRCRLASTAVARLIASRRL